MFKFLYQITKRLFFHLKSKFSLQSLRTKPLSRSTRSRIISCTFKGQMFMILIKDFCELGIVTLKSSRRMPFTTSMAVSSVSRAGNLMLQSQIVNRTQLPRRVDVHPRQAWVEQKHNLLGTQEVGNIGSRLDVVRENASRLYLRSPLFQPQVFCQRRHEAVHGVFC